MKKILLLTVLFLLSFSLIGCTSDEKKLEKAKDEVQDSLETTLTENDILKDQNFEDYFNELVEENEYYKDNEEFAVIMYVNDRITSYVIPMQVIEAIKNADLTIDQVNLIKTAIEEEKGLDYSDGSEDNEKKILNFWVNLFFDLELSDDVIIRMIHDVLTGLDDDILKELNSIKVSDELKSNLENSIDEIQKYLEDEEMAKIFNITEAELEDIIIVSDIVFGNGLKYVYSLENYYNDILNGVVSGELTKEKFQKIISSQKEAFDNSYGTITEAKIKECLGTLVKYKGVLGLPEFDVDDSAKLGYKTLETYKAINNEVCKADNLDVLYEITVNDSNEFNKTKVFAAKVVAAALSAENGLTIDEIKEHYGADLTVLRDTAKAINFGYKDSYTAEEEALLNAFVDEFESLGSYTEIL